MPFWKRGGLAEVGASQILPTAGPCTHIGGLHGTSGASVLGPKPAKVAKNGQNWVTAAKTRAGACECPIGQVKVVPGALACRFGNAGDSPR